MIDPMGFPGGSVGEESACNAADLGLIPGLGRSPGGGHGNPPVLFLGESPWTEEPGWLQVHRVTKSRTQLSDLARHSRYHNVQRAVIVTW